MARKACLQIFHEKVPKKLTGDNAGKGHDCLWGLGSISKKH